MAEFRTIRMAFWTDPYIEELEPKAKLLYIYLFTCPHTNNLGIVESTRRKIAYETGLSLTEVNNLIGKFENDGKIVCDQERNLIFVTRFVRHQSSTSPLLMKGLKKIAVLIPSEKIARAVCILYPQVFGVDINDSDMVSIPYADGKYTLSIPSAEFRIVNYEFGIRNVEVEAGKPAVPNCPHKEIIQAYHEQLPTLPRVKVWNKEREAHLQARWRERLAQGKYSTTEEGIAYWTRLFQHVNDCPWLMGQITPRDGKPFFADLAWLVKPENFAKLIEGKYDRRADQ